MGLCFLLTQLPSIDSSAQRWDEVGKGRGEGNMCQFWCSTRVALPTGIISLLRLEVDISVSIRSSHLSIGL